MASCQLRNQKFCQPEENCGREHDHGENHAADQPEGCQRAVDGGVSPQSLWYHQVFQCGDAAFEIVRHSQRQGSLRQSGSNGNPWTGRGMLPQPQGGQTPKGQQCPCAAAADDAQTGSDRIRSRKQHQRAQGQRHGTKLLRNFDDRQCADAVGSDKIPRHDPAQTADGQKCREKPQRL